MTDKRDEMKIREVRPSGPLDAVVRVPGSKSYTQRSLVIAALAEGGSVLRNALHSDDTGRLVEALRCLGAGILVKDADLVVDGTGGRIGNSGTEIYLGNNGTAMRFLTSLVCLGHGVYTLTGDARLCERPMRPLLDALTHLGAQYHCRVRPGCAPFDIRASSLSGGKVEFSDIESSQYVSSLMLSAPYANGDVIIEVDGPLVSRPYVDMTVRVMEEFGVSVTEEVRNRFVISGGRHYHGREYVVESDASSASYFLLSAALCGGSVKIPGLSGLSHQGDMGFLDILERAGCRVFWNRDSVEVKGGILAPGEQIISLGHMPDMVPTVAVLASCRPGRTVIEHVPHLRFKESDRLKALAVELAKTGIRVREHSDGLVIEGGNPRGAEIETYEDHRIAMSFAILGLVAPGMKIRNPDCVNKSFPGFWERLECLYR